MDRPPDIAALIRATIATAEVAQEVEQPQSVTMRIAIAAIVTGLIGAVRLGIKTILVKSRGVGLKVPQGGTTFFARMI